MVNRYPGEIFKRRCHYIKIISFSANRWIGIASPNNRILILHFASSLNSRKDYCIIYKIDISGKNKKNLGKINHGDNINAYYNDQLYIERHDSNFRCDYTYIHTYEFDIKTKKSKMVIKNFVVCDQNKQYIIGVPNSGSAGPLPIKVYSIKNRRTYSITETGGSACFIGNKVYYAGFKGYGGDRI